MGKRRPPSRDAAPPAHSAGATSVAIYAPAVNAGFQATTARVQEMHQAIAGKTFDGLLHVPGLTMPTRIVQGVHDAITQGVYAALRHGGAATLALAAGIERKAVDPTRRPGRKEQAVRSALNGAVGDSLAASGSALAVQMGLHGRDGPLTPAALASLQPRVCVFLHGLACDELSWRLGSDAWAGSQWASTLPAGEPIDYGALLEHELGVSAVWLRYNSGLAIEHNAQQLADLMVQGLQGAPQVREWLLIGHSMGGLVARRAHALAAAQGLGWARRVPMIVCLGSPHLGAPLAQAGHLAAAALNVADVTRPLGRIADARSRGIKDMRRGLRDAPRAPDEPALRLVFGTLGNAEGTGLGSLVGSLLGDGLVRAGNAADDAATGDVQRVELAGLGHMSLLNHPRVYAVIRRWLGAPDD
jgi:pimeloyl-ACP methyl ester carboxylesterase